MNTSLAVSNQLDQRKIPAWLKAKLDQAADEGQLPEQIRYAAELARRRAFKKAEAAAFCSIHWVRKMCLDNLSHKWSQRITCDQRNCLRCGPKTRKSRIDNWAMRAGSVVDLVRHGHGCHDQDTSSHIKEIASQVWELRGNDAVLTATAARNLNTLVTKLVNTVGRHVSVHAALSNIDIAGGRFRVRLLYLGPDVREAIKKKWGALTNGKGSCWIDSEGKLPSKAVYDILYGIENSPEQYAWSEAVFKCVRQVHSFGILYDARTTPQGLQGASASPISGDDGYDGPGSSSSQDGPARHAVTGKQGRCPFCGCKNIFTAPGFTAQNRLTPMFLTEYPDVYGDRWREGHRTERAA